eukprot:PhF_6_TR11334/c0_g1_i1/m.18305
MLPSRYFWICFAALLNLFSSANAQSCQSSGNIDFTGIPTTHCTQMTQYMKGQKGGLYDFDFNWCTVNPAFGCSAGFVIQGHSNTCDRSFSSWTSGMAPGSNGGVTFSVNDGTGNVATIKIECDGGGPINVVSCPSQYQVTPQASNTFLYEMTLRSKCACQNGGCGGNSGSEPSGGLTGGGVFLIVFFVSATVYIGAGT